MLFTIGPYQINPGLVLAPMAGVTDRPFRQLCRQLGAGLAVSEMVTSDTRLWATDKSRRRLEHSNEQGPISVQIAGNDPVQMAQAAQRNVDQGAQIIDINMGCPAKKVCKKAAGSALLQDEALVARIVQTVVQAVPVPVTLKIRTGWAPEHRNGPAIAHIAEDSGIQALAVHGRTRSCRFKPTVEYKTIRAIKQQVSIPVIANGDIVDGPSALKVLQETGADGLMIGRAAQGNPWIFQQIQHYLVTGRTLPAPATAERHQVLIDHVQALYALYGEWSGVRIARKHVGWYFQTQPDGARMRHLFNRLDTPDTQLDLIHQYFARVSEAKEKYQAA